MLGIDFRGRRVISRAGLAKARPLLIAAATLTLFPAAESLASGDEQAAALSHINQCDAGNATANAERRACLQREYERLDRKLNATYRSVRKQLRSGELRNRLVESQRAWVWRRDSDCERKAEEARANRDAPQDLTYEKCRLGMVAERIEWLQKVPSHPDYLKKV